MAYAFERSESIPAAIVRILSEQIERATAQLVAPNEPEEKRVHDARKRFKEIRAVLRMIREPLGDQFAVENAWFRDAARDLATARDAQAVIEAIDALIERAQDGDERRALRTTRRRLVKRRDAMTSADLDAKIANTMAQLPIAHARITTTWPAIADRFATIGDGLLRTYRDGRRALERARTDPSAENHHEWRKRVKDHWYHAQLLRHVWPEMSKAHRDVMEQLSDALGDHHDLDVLRTLVPPDSAALPVIDRRRAELEAVALALGRRVYAERPRAWHDRTREQWKIWRED